MSDKLLEMAKRVVSDGVAPAASVAVAARRGGRWVVEAAGAGLLGRGRQARATAATPFDIASVSKPFLACTAARLARAEALELEAPVEALLPDVAGTPAGAMPLITLLAHRGGLEAHRDLFAPLEAGRAFRRREALREAAKARREECRGAPPPDGFDPLYSDLGYLLVGAALEAHWGEPLDELVGAQVCEPLGLDAGSARQWLKRDPSFPRHVAPTEVVGWRGGALSGVVHDENAWALAGYGLAGHAGLFATVETLARFGAALLDALAGRAPGFLSAAAMSELVAERPGGSLRAGFDGKSPQGSAAGSLAGPRTFGHLGFTGTSLWCDPDRDAAVAVLTNRVHPSRNHLAIRRARPAIHDALFEHAAAMD